MEFLQLVSDSPSLSALLGVIISSLFTFSFGLVLLKIKIKSEKESRIIELKRQHYGEGVIKSVGQREIAGHVLEVF